MNIGAIIQARASSQRLPGKVLLNLPFHSRTTVLEQVVTRVKHSKMVKEVIVATSDHRLDQSITVLSEKMQTPVFTGSLNNVLERFYKAATKYSFDVIVRITADCPCIDPEIIDRVIEHHLKNGADFTSCSTKRTYPVGIDVGVMNYSALKKAYENATSDYDVEHVTSFFYQTQPEHFKIDLVEANGKHREPNIRLTLDTPEDYILLCTIYDNLYTQNIVFGIDEILDFLNNKPWLKEINNRIPQKKFCDDISIEVKEVLEYCKKQDLTRIYTYLSDRADEIQKMST